MCPWVYYMYRQSALCHWRLQEYFYLYTHIIQQKLPIPKKNSPLILLYVSNRFYFVNLDFFNSHTDSVYYSRKSQHPLKISAKTRSFFLLMPFSPLFCLNVLFRWTLNTNWNIQLGKRCSMVVSLSVYGEYGRKRNVWTQILRTWEYQKGWYFRYKKRDLLYYYYNGGVVHINANVDARELYKIGEVRWANRFFLLWLQKKQTNSISTNKCAIRNEWNIIVSLNALKW